MPFTPMVPWIESADQDRMAMIKKYDLWSAVSTLPDTVEKMAVNILPHNVNF